jgi:hypothetical protein
MTNRPIFRGIFEDARQNTQARHLVFPPFARVTEQYSNSWLGGPEIGKPTIHIAGTILLHSPDVMSSAKIVTDTMTFLWTSWYNY